MARSHVFSDGKIFKFKRNTYWKVKRQVKSNVNGRDRWLTNFSYTAHNKQSVVVLRRRMIDYNMDDNNTRISNVYRVKS